MARRSTVTVSLALLLVLAGCSGLVGNGGTPTAQPPESFEYADGFGPDGITDGSAAVDSYVAAVQAHGSYAGNYGYEVTTAQGNTTVDVAYRVDFEGQRAYRRVDVDVPQSTGWSESFFTTDTLYQRSALQGGEPNVTVRERSFPSDDLTAKEAIRPLLENASAYDARTEIRNGTEVVVYTATESTDVDAFLGVADSENVSSFEATFVVDGDGLIRSASYDITYRYQGERRSVAMTFELSGLGNTTVDRPDWVEQA